jgi:hypothetical protein
MSSAPDAWLIDDRAGIWVDGRDVRPIMSQAADVGMRRASHSR